MVRVVDDVPELIVAPADQTASGEPIVITEDDISNLIKTKGAVLAAVRVLLKTLEMDFLDLEKLYVAGGFGAHLDIEKAIFIGLLPDIPKGTNPLYRKQLPCRRQACPFYPLAPSTGWKRSQTA